MDPVAHSARQAGGKLRGLRKGPYTASRIMRWCAAQQNWDRIHYDQAYAQQRAGLAERLINGAMKQHLLVQFLQEAMPGAWIAALEFRFVQPDFVDQTLEVRGQVMDRTRSPHGEVDLVRVQFEIVNLCTDAVSTSGCATLELPRAPGGPRFASTLPPEWGEVGELGEGAELLRTAFQLEPGCILEAVRSVGAIDPSRLRLFADAIGGLPAWHHDCAAAAVYGRPPLAAPLFPIHAIEREPGALPLSDHPDAMGREGVSEIGRSIPQLGLGPQGMVNGGSRLRIHALAQAGDVIAGTSRLVGLKWRPEARGGPFLGVETHNRYETTAGRRLLDERFLMIYRNVRLPGDPGALPGGASHG